MDQIAAAIRDERITMILRRESVAAIDGHSRGASEITRRTPTAFDHSGNCSSDAPPGPEHPPRLVRTDAINFRGRTIGGDARPRRRHGVQRVSPAVTFLEH